MVNVSHVKDKNNLKKFLKSVAISLELWPNRYMVNEATTTGEKNMSTLKHENVAEIGDSIKAYDFQPREGHPEYFLIGKVTAKGKTKAGFAGYTVTVTESPEHTVREGIEMYVPFEMFFDEWDARVTRV